MCIRDRAYTTRVGEGPFPAELTDAIGERLGERGNEFGTVTGRKRRCGWFDAVLVRQSVTIAGIDGICLTKLDVLDGLEAIKLCVGYRLHGKEVTEMPATYRALEAVEPVYEKLPGWKTSTRGVTRWDDLPAKARAYLTFLEERCV